MTRLGQILIPVYGGSRGYGSYQDGGCISRRWVHQVPVRGFCIHVPVRGWYLETLNSGRPYLVWDFDTIRRKKENKQRLVCVILVSSRREGGKEGCGRRCGFVIVWIRDCVDSWFVRCVCIAGLMMCCFFFRVPDSSCCGFVYNKVTGLVKRLPVRPASFIHPRPDFAAVPLAYAVQHSINNSIFTYCHNGEAVLLQLL